MLSINRAKVLSSPLLPSSPLFTRENTSLPTSPPPSPGISRAFTRGATLSEGVGFSTLRPRPIAARARPVTSRAPLRTVISQSHRRLPANQPLARLYLRANDFQPTLLSFSLFYFNVSCKKKEKKQEHAPRTFPLPSSNPLCPVFVKNPDGPERLKFQTVNIFLACVGRDYSRGRLESLAKKIKGTRGRKGTKIEEVE